MDRRSAADARRPAARRRGSGDLPPGTPRIVWTGRLVALVAMTLWASSIVLGRLTEMPTMLHATVILFHEAGHVLFGPFGEVLGVAGGTLAQLLMPLTCAVALFRRGDRFGAALCLVWTGMSLMDAAVYAYDAADPQLTLIGGGTGADSFHDFIFLLERFDQLGHARGWARAMKALGAIGAGASLLWAGTVLIRQREMLTE